MPQQKKLKRSKDTTQKKAASHSKLKVARRRGTRVSAARPFRFLDLPPELRWRVYDYLFRARTVYVEPHKAKPQNAKAQAILRVNKQIHSEAMASLYQKSTFEISLGHEYIGFLYDVIDPDVDDWNPLNLQFIKHITITICMASPAASDFIRLSSFGTKDNLFIVAAELERIPRLESLKVTLNDYCHDGSCGDENFEDFDEIEWHNYPSASILSPLARLRGVGKVNIQRPSEPDSLSYSLLDDWDCYCGFNEGQKGPNFSIVGGADEAVDEGLDEYGSIFACSHYDPELKAIAELMEGTTPVCPVPPIHKEWRQLKRYMTAARSFVSCGLAHSAREAVEEENMKTFEVERAKLVKVVRAHLEKVRVEEAKLNLDF